LAYLRVLPRDLFNEAKLLKCLGQLALILHDHEGQFNVELIHRKPELGFIIDQHSDNDGSLYCRNLKLRFCRTRRIIELSTVYNSKAPYPFCFENTRGKDVDMGDVFNDDGTFSTEFLELIKKKDMEKEACPECKSQPGDGYTPDCCTRTLKDYGVTTGSPLRVAPIILPNKDNK
jgi:hypothetical protein